MKELSSIYSSLFRYESKLNRGSYPIHKRLKFKHDQNLLDFIMDKVQFKAGENILDAGCGTGHTLFYLSKKHQILGTGISISKDEIEFAKRETARLQLAQNLHFQLMSYDEQLPGLYDKIFCIESLKHSNNIKGTVDNLLNSLLKDGTLIIVDDFLLKKTNNTDRHRKLWASPGFGTLKQLKDVIDDIGHFDIEAYELTEQVPTRPLPQILFTQTMVTVAAIFSFKHLKRNLKTYKGALLLEKLYNEKIATYWILIIKRKDNGNYTRST